jgi:hypothetical protein
MNMTHPAILETEAHGMPEPPLAELSRCAHCCEESDCLVKCFTCEMQVCPGCTATKYDDCETNT